MENTTPTKTTDTVKIFHDRYYKGVKYRETNIQQIVDEGNLSLNAPGCSRSLVVGITPSQGEEAEIALSGASHCVDAGYRRALRDVLEDVEGMKGPSNDWCCDVVEDEVITAKIKARLENKNE